MPQPRQPFLHDLTSLVAAPTQVWSAADGEIDPAHGGQGILHADVRMLSALEMRVDGRPVEHVATDLGPAEVSFTYLLRGLDGVAVEATDPALRLDRVRRVRPGEVSESVTVASVLDRPVTLNLTLRFGTDLVPIEAVKVGSSGELRPLTGTDDGGLWSESGEVEARLSADAATVVTGTDDLTLGWELTVPAHGEVSAGWRLALTDSGGVVRAAPAADATADAVERALTLAGEAATDHRLRPWAERAMADLAGLRMTTLDDPDDAFYAAGAPWYFTLFGRDSILSAQLMLAVDPAMAIGTLRTLARLQGRRVDPESAEEPGKIIHELRRGTFAFAGVSLPPRYYGTVDATPLFVCLLHDAWRAGVDEDVLQELLPALRGALNWIMEHGDPADAGFLAYLDPTGRGLSNQGWKDSADSVRFADGRIAEGPIALCEVQGYAHEAAVGGAALLDALGEPGGDQLRTWADGLAARFRAWFWCERDGRRFPALALDGHGARVDSLTSNIGHLIATGLLDPDEERLVAGLVSGPELDSGLGLRTLAADEVAYAPLSYHCGSVWPHDTAVVIARLLRAGLGDHARGLAQGLLRARVAFDGRLPELWSGEGRPVPYPMACRPQAWSAAAIVPVLVSLGQTVADAR